MGIRKCPIPEGLVGNINMTAVPLSRDTNMAVETSRENTLLNMYERRAGWSGKSSTEGKSRGQDGPPFW